jgi:hypothetical protein
LRHLKSNPVKLKKEGKRKGLPDEQKNDKRVFETSIRAVPGGLKKSEANDLE